jgi:hypothetical protein
MVQDAMSSEVPAFGPDLRGALMSALRPVEGLGCLDVSHTNLADPREIKAPHDSQAKVQSHLADTAALCFMIC